MTPVRMLMADLVRDNLVQRKLGIYRLDTLLIRETRLVSQLGQAAIEKYLEALRLLVPDSWDQSQVVPVNQITTDIRKGVGGRRVVIRLNHTDEILQERERAKAITLRMTGLELPPFPHRLDITLGKLKPVFDNDALQSRLDEIAPTQVTLLPTTIET